MLDIVLDAGDTVVNKSAHFKKQHPFHILMEFTLHEYKFFIKVIS